MQQDRKRNKRYTYWEGRNKTVFFFTDDMIIYVENTKESNKKLLELISSYGKVAGYKVNIQKSTAFLYSSSE